MRDTELMAVQQRGKKMKPSERRYGYCDEIASIVDMSKLTIEGGEEMTTDDVIERLNQLEAENRGLIEADKYYYANTIKIEAKNASARAIMQKFVDKVDRGMARSTETYAEMKEWMEDE